MTSQSPKDEALGKWKPVLSSAATFRDRENTWYQLFQLNKVHSIHKYPKCSVQLSLVSKNSTEATVES